jgi:hypothetical protein
MALVGYELEKQRIDSKIKEIRSKLGRGAIRSSSMNENANSSAAPRKRILSAAARKRIAAAQKKRWAEHRRKTAQASKQ